MARTFRPAELEVRIRVKRFEDLGKSSTYFYSFFKTTRISVHQEQYCGYVF